jgi:ribosomal protein S12 methylthiotransferase accessory factor YcaO
LNNLVWAPWVVKGSNLLLGLQLKVLRLSHLELDKIPPDKIVYLQKNNFLIETTPFRDSASILTDPENAQTSAPINWVWVTANEFLAPAIQLVEHLSQLNPTLHWEIAKDKQSILDSLKNSQKKPFIVRLAHQEPIAERIYDELYSDLIDRAQIIWVGETLEGAHIGPLLCSAEEVAGYFKATQIWYFSQTLLDAGFTEYWPSSLYSNLKTSPLKVAQAILQIVTSEQGTCFLLSENKTVSLWTGLLRHSITEDAFFKTQFWSKGLIRNFTVMELDSIPEAYITTCRTPCGSRESLEGNSGKGENIRKATYTLVGEAVERFSAWHANHCFQQGSTTTPPESSIVYDIQQFHPFGPAWESYLIDPKPALPLYPVRDELNPGPPSFVPECLIPFPYQPNRPEYTVTRSSTSGLAAHSDYKRAVIKGALELLERHDFYPNFMFQILGYVLDCSKLPSYLTEEWSHLIRLLKRLKAKGINYWFVLYYPQSTIPIVHCFLQDQHAVLLSRGTGSGYTLLEAVMGSLLEALQIREQLLKTLKNNPNPPEDSWIHPSVIASVLNYLNRCHVLPIQDYSGLSLKYTDDLLFEEIKKTLRELNKPLLVADLPCPIQGWTVVRVLIPGFTTHQDVSHSEGGKSLLNQVFKYRIPT